MTTERKYTAFFGTIAPKRPIRDCIARIAKTTATRFRAAWAALGGRHNTTERDPNAISSNREP